jgi:hypothetical protein
MTNEKELTKQAGDLSADRPPACGIVEQPNSTEISINAKGMWSGSVKCYGITPDDSFQSALIKALALQKIIRDNNVRLTE